MPFTDVNGQHVYFEDSGGDGPAVVFSHGFLMDHEMFAPQVTALAPEFRCIVGRDDITDRFSEISAPAIIFHGDADAAIPMPRAEALCAGIADCRGIVVVEGAAHAPNLSHPDAVNGPLVEFLREVC